MNNGASKFKNAFGNFIALALVFAVLSFISVPILSWGINSTKKLLNYSTTTATVSDIISTTEESDGNVQVTLYEAVLDYTVNGKQYRSSIKDDSESYEIGDKAKILVNPENPKDISEESWSNALGAIAIGLLFAVGAWAALHTIIFRVIIPTQSTQKEYIKGFLDNAMMLICFAVFAALLLGLGINEINDRDYFVPTTATISRIELNTGRSTAEFTIYVDYEVKGEQYSNILYEYHSDYVEGKKVKILYNPENPDEIQPASWFTINIFMGIGIAFGLIALFLLYRQIFFKNAFRRQQTMTARQML